MDFSNYQYKTLSSLNFKKHVLKNIKKHKNLKFINDTILNVREESEKVIVVGNKKNYFANHVFDSRLTKNLFNEIKHHTFLKQHFVGWVLKQIKRNSTKIHLYSWTIKYVNP